MTAPNRGSISRPKDRQKQLDAARLDWKDATGDVPVPYLGGKPPFLTDERLVCVCDDDFGYWELRTAFWKGSAPDYTQHYR